MKKQVLGWLALALVLVAAVTWAGITNKAAVFDGIVESTLGGFMFPDQSVQTTAMVDTTCDGQPCDGTYFTNVNSAVGPGLVVRDSVGTLVGLVVGFSTNNGGPLVDFRYDSLPVLLVVRKNYLALPEKLFFEGTGNPVFRRVYYEQTGCFGSAYTGQGWTDVENLVGTPESFHAVGYGNILYGEWDGSLPPVTVNSYSDNPSHCEDLEPNQGIGDGYPLVQVLDFDDLFTPPFHIE